MDEKINKTQLPSRTGTSKGISRNNNLLFHISNRLGSAAFNFRDPVKTMTFFGKRSNSTADNTSNLKIPST